MNKTPISLIDVVLYGVLALLGLYLLFGHTLEHYLAGDHHHEHVEESLH